MKRMQRILSALLVILLLPLTGMGKRRSRVTVCAWT